MAEWISVKERLPEDGKYVLAYSADDDFMKVEARHHFGVFQITHWMPLPEPPKEANETPSKLKRGWQRKSEKTNKSQKPFADYRWGDCQGEEGGPRHGSCEMGEA